MTSLLFPLGALVGLAPHFIHLDDPKVGRAQMTPIRGGQKIFSSQHPAIASEQHRFSFVVLLLPRQAGSEQALGSESLPAIRFLCLFRRLGLAG